MLVEPSALGWVGARHFSPSPPLPIRPCRKPQALSAATTSTSHHDVQSSAIIDHDGDTQRHIVTIPSFLPLEEDDCSGSYPSPLHKIHVLPFLTEEETSTLHGLARKHATETKSWEQQDASRHVSYQTVDFAVEASVEISQYLGGRRFEDRIFGALSDAYTVDAEDMSFLDLFIASYEASGNENVGKDTMDSLAFHRDGSLLSFTILLSPTDEFEGGGTIFDALGDIDCDGDSILLPPGVIQPPGAGYATLHSGKLLHGGHVVTEGQRIVLVGFVDVHERNAKPGALGAATKEWGRNDVRSFWNRRRLDLRERQKIGDGQPLWKPKNWRYLPKDTEERRVASGEGQSYFGRNSAVPASVLENFEARASPERIRRRRLMTEDALLRELLLPRNERQEKVEEEEGEWMEVDLDSFDGLSLGWEEVDAGDV
ncbi:hypothetical protein ACHAXT_006942 [Thalassiosira profunda]